MARRRADRRRGPFAEGRRDAAARDARHRRGPAARRRARRAARRGEHPRALPQGARVGTSAPRRAAQLLHAAARLPGRAVPRQCRHPARQARRGRGRRDVARRRRARAAGRDAASAIRSRPRTGCPPRRRARSGSNAAPTMRGRARCSPRSTTRRAAREVMAERALLAALGGNCHSPIAVLYPRGGRAAGAHRCDCSAPTAPNGSRARRRSPRAMTEAPARLAADLLARAPAAIAAHFDGAGVSLPAHRHPPRARVLPRRWRAARALGLARDRLRRCSRSRRLAWDAPDPHDFDALLLGSANALRHGGAGARRACAHCRSMRSGKRTAARRARGRVSRSRRSGRAACNRCSTLVSPAPLRLLRLAGEARVELAPPSGVRGRPTGWFIAPSRCRSRPRRWLRWAAAARSLLHSGEAARHFACRVRPARACRARASRSPRSPRASPMQRGRGGARCRSRQARPMRRFWPWPANCANDRAGEGLTRPAVANGARCRITRQPPRRISGACSAHRLSPSCSRSWPRSCSAPRRCSISPWQGYFG